MRSLAVLMLCVTFPVLATFNGCSATVSPWARAAAVGSWRDTTAASAGTYTFNADGSFMQQLSRGQWKIVDQPDEHTLIVSLKSLGAGNRSDGMVPETFIEVWRIRFASGDRMIVEKKSQLSEAWEPWTSFERVVAK